MSLWVKHPGVRTGSDLKFRERAADALKMAFGTWTLLGLIIAGIITWMHFVRDPGELHLNLGLSFLASVQGVILQIAANRGDRINAEVALHTQQNTDELVTLNRAQIEILQRLDGLDGKVADLADVVRQVMAQRAEHDATVAADAKRAATAAESAFVATQVLASQTGPQPALAGPEPGKSHGGKRP
jgi:uncharacterized membrane protein